MYFFSLAKLRTLSSNFDPWPLCWCSLLIPNLCKNEKFLVINGEAVFKFESLNTGERYELKVNGKNPEIVETIPGWTHDITNCGEDKLIVMLWANEIFDEDKPDTIAKELF